MPPPIGNRRRRKAARMRSLRDAGPAIMRRRIQRAAQRASHYPDPEAVASDLDFKSGVALVDDDGDCAAIHAIQFIHSQFMHCVAHVALLYWRENSRPPGYAGSERRTFPP